MEGRRERKEGGMAKWKGERWIGAREEIKEREGDEMERRKEGRKGKEME